MTERTMPEAIRKLVALLLCLTCQAAFAPAQEISIQPVKPDSIFLLRPYQAAEVPPIRMSNSSRLGQLVRAGTLYLTAQDAIALALENNIDIEVARYNPILAAWRLQRAEAGGALPGVPSVASQAGSVASGQGVSGSQQAAGVSGGRTSGSGGGTANATISQIGPVTQTLDPIVQLTASFSHISTPQPNLVQSLTPNLISDTRVYSGSIQQGFLTGGQLTLSYRQNWLEENSPSNLLNPSVATNLQLAGQQSLLRGFGRAVNARTITVSKMNVAISDLNFKSTVIAIVNQVLARYWALAAAYEDLKAKRTSAQVAQTFLENIKEQVRIGSIAPTDQINAEAQQATTQQAVVDSQAAVEQHELALKNLISRNATADPVLAAVRIVPVDPIRIPEKDDVAALNDMVKGALAGRIDLTTAKSNLAASEVSALGTRNNIRPTLVVFGSISNAGLAGTPRTVVGAPGEPIQQPDAYFVGGLGTALAQMFRRNFPSERIGVFYQQPFRNRSAQADFAIDQLQLRQAELSNQKLYAAVEVDLMNYVIALRQARSRYEASVKNRDLQQKLFEAEQKKFSLGASTPYDVLRQQRDLIAAQASEVTSLTSYISSRTSLDTTLGTTLQVNNVTIAPVQSGTPLPGPVPQIPATPVPSPPITPAPGPAAPIPAAPRP